MPPPKLQLPREFPVKGLIELNRTLSPEAARANHLIMKNGRLPDWISNEIADELLVYRKKRELLEKVWNEDMAWYRAERAVADLTIGQRLRLGKILIEGKKG